MARRTQFQRQISEFRRKGGGSRHTIKRVLGGKLDRHGAVFEKEQMHFEDDREGPRTVDIVQTNTCSFGHTVDDKVRVTGVCELGGEVLCSTEGCMFQCIRCGVVVCRRHSATRADKTYCHNCRWVYYWRKFWGLE